MAAEASWFMRSFKDPNLFLSVKCFVSTCKLRALCMEEEMERIRVRVLVLMLNVRKLLRLILPMTFLIFNKRQMMPRKKKGS
jgi:hypothetical protein